MNCEQSTFDLLLEALGRDKLNVLRNTFGGRDFYPPNRVESLSDDSPLVKALGMEAARSLVETMRGARFYVPLPPEIADSDRRFTRLKAEGLSNREIAERLNVSERSVRRALARISARKPDVTPTPDPTPWPGTDVAVRLMDQGMTTSQIADALGLGVWRVRGEFARARIINPNDGRKKGRNAPAAQRPADGPSAPVSTPRTRKPEMAS